MPIVIVILILVLGIIGYLFWTHKRNQNKPVEPRDNYQNPIYNPNTIENTNNDAPSFYADVPEASINNYMDGNEYSDNINDTGYMDVQPEEAYINSESDL